MSITGTWTIGRTTDFVTFEDTGAVGPCSYEDSWAYCGGLSDATYTYQPKGTYHCGIASNVTGAPLIEPDPPIPDFQGYPQEAGAWVQGLSDNSDPHLSYGCNLIGP